MKRTPVLAVAAAVAVAVAAGLWWQAGRAGAPPQVSGSPAASSVAPPAEVTAVAPPVARGPDAQPQQPAGLPLAAPSGPVALGSGEVPVFKITPRGELVIDRETRNAIERVLALNDRPDAHALLRESAASLPPMAARQLLDAANNFSNYQTALTQTFPPGAPPADAREALQQIDALHALRVQQLGADVATAYFGDEEAAARRLIAELVGQGQLPAGLATTAGSTQRP